MHACTHTHSPWWSLSAMRQLSGTYPSTNIVSSSLTVTIPYTLKSTPRWYVLHTLKTCVLWWLHGWCLGLDICSQPRELWFSGVLHYYVWVYWGMCCLGKQVMIDVSSSVNTWHWFAYRRHYYSTLAFRSDKRYLGEKESWIVGRKVPCNCLRW